MQRLRLSMIPAGEIDAELPRRGLIYEIGSGYGSLGAFLASSADGRQVVGLEFDEAKLTGARGRFASFNLRFERADVRAYAYLACAGAVMSDFLHHIPVGDQERLLTAVAAAVEPEGVVVIKEIDREDGWRRAASRLWDQLLYPQDRIYYRSQAELRGLMERLGFTVTVARRTAWFPGSTFLYVCRKRR